MDLRNNQITLGELLDNPASFSVLKAHFAPFLNHPMAKLARQYPLHRMLPLARQYVSPKAVEQALAELKAL